MRLLLRRIQRNIRDFVEHRLDSKPKDDDNKAGISKHKRNQSVTPQLIALMQSLEHDDLRNHYYCKKLVLQVSLSRFLGRQILGKIISVPKTSGELWELSGYTFL